MIDHDRLKTQLRDGRLVATIRCPKITDFEKPGLLSDLSKEAAANGHRLALDLAAVQLMGSSGIGLLLSLNKELREAGGKLAICNVADEIVEMLRVSHLLRVLPLHKDLDAAVRALA
ncbi:MAG: STAS domain-containing protein [Phycisphaerae bacterium]|nr:STAS domain-containing protein [Phycisphaerae bacterium]